MSKTIDPKLYSVIERVVTAEGLELVHCEFSGTGKYTVLRIYIDKPEGVTHKDCSYISTQLGMVLDVEDLISHQYLLEVSSPGVDRGLYKKSDYTRFAGQNIKLKLQQALNGRKVFRGRLEGLEEEKIKLTDEKETHLIPYELIASANIVTNLDELFRRAKSQEIKLSEMQ
ncbi:MAG: ribosome maturation factor RimP [Acidobacteria bacterium]|nr:ribosome maturation factor RimP [Acidobacteriota bacterium]